MREVLCFGELLIDFLCTSRPREGLLKTNQFTQFPGGAPANAAVAVAKLGGDASFLGQIGDDQFGFFLLNALKTYGVKTDKTLIHPTAKTALAFVFLNEQGERRFSFRREETADLLIEKTHIREDYFSRGPIVHFCSNTLTEKEIANVTIHLVKLATKKKSLISFDVNLRHQLWKSGSVDIDLVNSLVRKSHLVKFSREEFLFLARNDEQAYVSGCVSAGVKALIVTDGPRTITIHGHEGTATKEPPIIEAIDTTGGGDAFTGAMLYKLSQQSNPDNHCEDLGKLGTLVDFAARCGAIAVTRQGAFPAFPTQQDLDTG